MLERIPDYRQSDPKSSGGAMVIYCAAAEMRISLGDRAGAKEELEQGLTLDPGHAWALRLMEALKKTP